MKSKIIFLCSLALSLALKAQTFVSTEPSNKNVILEEYTGVNCQYCPDGHRMANELMKANPGRFFSINIHQGSFASTTPDYRTDFGDALANQAGISGYPTGTVNRHIFSGSKTALDRSHWEPSATQIMSQGSYVNVAVKSVIDAISRVLTVNVEIYYTANAPVSANYLNVALLQDNIIGPQSGMHYNPEQIVGNKYNHQHMLRHLITGQWGDEITTTSAGNFVSKTYTYTIPSHLRDIVYELHNLEVVAFITESHQEIITGTKSEISFINSNPVIKGLKEIETYSCNPEVQLCATVFNFTDDEISKLLFEYKIDDGPVNRYIWENQTIAPLATDTVHLPAIPVVANEKYTITFTITGYNEKEIEAEKSIPFEITINKNIVDVIGDAFIFLLFTDKYASQTSFAIFDSNGKIVKKDGPFTNMQNNGTTRRQYVFEPAISDCYKLEVSDTGGNGINSGNGAGYFKFMDEDENEIFYNDGKFGSQANYYINITKSDDVSIDKNSLGDRINLYPNPVGNVLYIDMQNVISLEVLNVQGQSIISADKNEINVSKLTPGIYFIKINSDKGVIIKKFFKS